MTIGSGTSFTHYTGGRYRMIVLQLPVQSVPITTKVVNSNHVRGEVYAI